MSDPAAQRALASPSNDGGRFGLRPADPSLALRLVGKALAAGNDLDETLQIVAELAAELSDAAYSRILLLEEDGCLSCRAGVGAGSLFIGDGVPGDQGLAGLAVTSKAVVFSPDVRADERAINRDRAAEHGIQAYLAFPLMLQSEVLGVMSVATKRPPDFSGDDIALLSAFADQSAAAVARARLRQAEQEQLKVITSLLAAANSIGGAVDLPSVLARLSEATMQIVGCRSCVIWLLDETTGRLWPAYPPGIGDQMASLLAQRPAGLAEAATFGKLAVDPKSTVIIEDTSASDLVPPEICHLLDATAMMQVPIMLGDRVLGAIGISCHRGPRRFTRREQTIAQGLASLAGIAIEHARTVARWEEAKVADERGRLAREVHDTLGQELVAIGSRLDLCRELIEAGEMDKVSDELDDVRKLVTQDIQEVRRTIAGLRPLDVERFGFLVAMRRYLEAYSDRSGVKSELVIHGEFLGMPSEVELVLYRVAQESLSNVRNHAQATKVTVELNSSLPESISLVIQDNGNGRAPGSEPRLDGRYGVGLVLMRERVERAGGKLQVDFLPGFGTTVSTVLPRSPR